MTATLFLLLFSAGGGDVAPFASRAVGATTITTFFSRGGALSLGTAPSLSTAESLSTAPSLGVAPGAGGGPGEEAGEGPGQEAGAGDLSGAGAGADWEPSVPSAGGGGRCRSRRQRLSTLSSWQRNRSTSAEVIPMAAAAVR